MRITVIPCGEVVNESEAAAIDRLKRELQNIGTPQGWDSDDGWILLTNLAFSVTHKFQSDDIDIIAIGPPGVRVIEVKHWSVGWCDDNADLVEQEADKLTRKARKIGTTLRRVAADLPRVDGTILLTRQPSNVRELVERGQIRGVSLFSLNQWKQVVGFEEPRVLTPNQVQSLAKAIEPKSAVRLEGSLRRLAGYVNLEQQTPKDERFHRIYRGSHPTRRNKVILHLYDLSASDEANAEARARREAESLQRLQLYPWAPRIVDSFQDAPGYAGEMSFFTVADPAAPTLKDRAGDDEWGPSARVLFAREAIRALAELHKAGDTDDALVHRNLTPQTILVRYDNTPIFTGFDRTRIPSDISVASSFLPGDNAEAWIAPEVTSHGLNAADQRSDIYSLSVCLSGLFAGQADGVSAAALEILATGQRSERDQRSKLSEIERSLSELLGDSVAQPPAPPSRFWTEDQIVRFNRRDYRIVSRLGSGGIGTTFKVVAIDRTSQEELGTYVGKIVHDGDTGRRVLKSYSLARPHLVRQDGLSTIFEVASEWQENEFVSLLCWIDGAPLSAFTGLFPLLAEDQDEPTPESLAIRWLRNLCNALDVLHRNGLTHGDVSPRNMIVSGSSLVLTDYDFVARFGEIPSSSGTMIYCSPERQNKQPLSPVDDLFALAASFFHVLFEKEPFRYAGELSKDRGLNWKDIDRAEFQIIADILDRATNPKLSERFGTAAEMTEALVPHQQNLSSQESPVVRSGHAPRAVQESRISSNRSETSATKGKNISSEMEERVRKHTEFLADELRIRLTAFADLPASMHVSSSSSGKKRGRRSNVEDEEENKPITSTGFKLAWECLDARHHTILEGIGGSGKTTTLEYVALRRAESYTVGGRVCIFAYIDEYHHASLIEFLGDRNACPECQHLMQRDIEELAEQGRIELILDGYDELSGDAQSFHRHLLQFSNINGTQAVALLLGSRPREELSSRFTHFIKLKEMDDDETRRQFVMQYVPTEDSEAIDFFLNELRASPGHNAIGSRPICLAMLLLWMSPDKKLPSRIPEAIGTLYRQLFWELYQREGTGGELFHGKEERYKILPKEKFEQVRLAIAGAVFASRSNDHSAKIVLTTISTALNPVLGVHAAEAVDLLLELPLFARARDKESLSFIHSTFSEYLMAEHILDRPDAGLEWIQNGPAEFAFTLSCVFELGGIEYYPRDGKVPSRATEEFVVACWKHAPLFVAGALRSDDFLSRMPCADPWWRGWVKILTQPEPTESFRETNLICEVELSNPPDDLIEGLTESDFWDAAEHHGCGKERMDRLWSYMTRHPEPWNDLWAACWEGVMELPSWLGHMDHINDIEERHSLGPFNRPPKKFNVEQSAQLHAREKACEERFTDWPQNQPIPDDDLPFDFEVRDAVRDAPARRVLSWMLEATCSEEDSLEKQFEYQQDPYRFKCQSDRFRFGDVLWFFQNCNWLLADEKISRRQWMMLWRKWDEVLVETGRRKYQPKYDVSLGIDADTLRKITDDPLLSPNVAACLTRTGACNASCFSEEQRSQWASEFNFLEARALYMAEIFGLQDFQGSSRISSWAKDTRCPDDASLLITGWPTNAGFPWARISSDACRHLLSHKSPAFDPLWSFFDVAPDHWDLVPAALRGRYADDRLIVAACRRISGPIRSDYRDRRHEVDGSNLTRSLLLTLKEGRLHWKDLLLGELAWLADASQLEGIHKLFQDGTIRLALLDHAPATIRESQTFKSIIKEQKGIGDAYWNRLRLEICSRLQIESLELNRTLAGGMSASDVHRIYMKRKNDEVARFAILKCTRDESDYDRELQGDKLARSSWLMSWLPESPVGLDLRPTLPDLVILTELAFPVLPNYQAVDSLHEVIERGDRDRSMVVARAIGKAYIGQFSHAVDCVRTLSGHVKHLLSHWHKADWSDAEFWSRAGVPNADTQRHQSLGCLLWNPLWCVTNDDWPGKKFDENCLFKYDTQHRDLNARNVLLSPRFTSEDTAPLEFKLIDFEKACRSSVILDPCWLTFWMMIASVRNASSETSYWDQLPTAMLGSILGKRHQQSLGSFDFGLELVREVFRTSSEHIEAATDVGNLLRNQLLTTLAAASLAKAFYEFRDIERFQIDDQGANTCQQHRRWGNVFFDLSALAFGELIGSPPRKRENS